MSALLLALFLTQSPAKPAAWTVVPQSSLAKIDATPLRNMLLRLDKPPTGDTLHIAYDTNGAATLATSAQETTIKEALGKVEPLAPQSDLFFGADVQQFAAAYMPTDGRFDTARALQRLGLDRLGLAAGGAKLTGKDGLHVDGLVTYPPPRSGLVEALGPSAPAVIPANAPSSDGVVMVSVRPSAFFNQANLAFAAASPVDQALFFTHLKGLESQLGKRFADDALGSTPRIWSFFERGREGAAVLEVADVGLVKAFLDRYAEAVGALVPGTAITRSKIGKRDVITATLPSKESVAFAFDTNALVVAPSTKALQAHFASKARGKATTVGPSAIAWGNAVDGKGGASFTVTLANEGFKLTGDAKVKR
ncbi:MAG TPA: hypothetical protein VLC93_12930 [Myxococcota bacterium]|nr:hypothetical protein [Myxococcota bacterium]